MTALHKQTAIDMSSWSQDLLLLNEPINEELDQGRGASVHCINGRPNKFRMKTLVHFKCAEQMPFVGVQRALSLGQPPVARKRFRSAEVRPATAVERSQMR